MKTIENSKYTFHKLRLRFAGLMAVLFFSALAVTGCGGGNATNTALNSDESGTVLIALTDAKGDFVSYSVDVLSIKMTHEDGRVIETLPSSSRIDFTEYTNLTEFITAATVPNGRYVKGSMVLDFSNADIWVESATGEAIAVNTILDVDGNAVSTMTVSVNLDTNNGLVVAPGIPMHLTLDFDLKATNRVIIAANNDVSIVVEPTLIADVNLNKGKQHRLRGPLKSVNVEQQRFQLFIRPLRKRLVQYDKHFGVLTVQTNNTTQYEIDGVSYQGDAGIGVMNTLDKFSGVIVHGAVKFNPLRFVAQQVFAGSSVAAGNLDVVHGSVISRTADSIKLHGATITRADGKIRFNDAITIQLAQSTVVKRRASMMDYDISALSIGSRVTIFGTVTNETFSNYQLDASNGYVRIGFTNLSGKFVSAVSIPEQAVPFLVKLETINGRSASLYNFAGTGIDSNNDARVDLYNIDTATLSLPNYADNTQLSVRGFVTAFGSAPKDFVARTLMVMTPPVAMQ